MRSDTDLLSIVPEFCEHYRRLSGQRVSPSRQITLQRAIEAIPGVDLEDLYWAGQASLGITPSERGSYDASFARCFLGLEDATVAGPSDPSDESTGADQPMTDPTVVEAPREGESSGSADDEEEVDDVGAEASVIEVLRLAPYASCSEQERATIEAMVRQMRFEPPHKLTRRTQPTPHGSRLDLRRTVRSAFRSGGPIQPRWREHRRKARRLVILIDVSRSMGAYSRLFLYLAHAMVGRQPATEVVCFGTRTTRVTRLLRRQRSVASIERAAASVLDWDGGTRIGEAVQTVQKLGVVRGSLRDSVVLIMSDGLEQAEHHELHDSLRRLRRTSHSVVWANPLAGDPRYEPLTAGMIAALPSIDALVACDTVASLHHVIETVVRFQAAPRSPGPYGRLYRGRSQS